ncbi:MAG TPA: hypothetical protein VKV15_25990 [Bryobacteraceae bacterium]|jgi:hypothetical protein|nr:hypothetical protein [Bryobacteraceae bacterium]
MAHRFHRRHRSSRRHRNPGFFGFRRHRRRNPILGMSGGDLLVETAAAVVNGVATRVVPQMILGSNNTGVVGYGANAITGLAGAWLAGKFSQKAGHGALLGAAVAVASRILSDTMGQNALGGGLSGDLGGELGFYINNSFPLPTAGSGPLLLNPGYTGSTPQNTLALPGMAPTPVTTAAGTTAVSPGGAGGANAALATTSAPSSAPGVWMNPWAS